MDLQNELQSSKTNEERTDSDNSGLDKISDEDCNKLQEKSCLM